MTSHGSAIESLEGESRRFPPPADLAAEAVAREDLYERAEADPDAF